MTARHLVRSSVEYWRSCSFISCTPPSRSPIAQPINDSHSRSLRTLFLLERLQLRLSTFRDRIAVGVQEHRHHVVPSHHADQIYHSSFTDSILGGAERGVAHLFGIQQLRTEGVDGFFVFLHPCGTLALRDGVRNRRAQPRLKRRAMVRLPFILRS